jgi:hypothetical protein
LLQQFAAEGFLLRPDRFTPAEVKVVLNAVTELGKSREMQEHPARIYESASGTVPRPGAASGIYRRPAD